MFITCARLGARSPPQREQPEHYVIAPSLQGALPPDISDTDGHRPLKLPRTSCGPFDFIDESAQHETSAEANFYSGPSTGTATHPEVIVQQEPYDEGTSVPSGIPLHASSGAVVTTNALAQMSCIAAVDSFSSLHDDAPKPQIMQGRAMSSILVTQPSADVLPVSASLTMLLPSPDMPAPARLLPASPHVLTTGQVCTKL